jgi:hypothetical protein
MRLFMAPGVAHCAGGAGPNPVGLLEAVVDWVENRVAPQRILATRIGTGSTDDAANFACVDGRHDEDDFSIGNKSRRHHD